MGVLVMHGFLDHRLVLVIIISVFIVFDDEIRQRYVLRHFEPRSMKRSSARVLQRGARDRMPLLTGR